MINLQQGETLCECDLIACGFHHAKYGYSCASFATQILAHETHQHAAALCPECARAWQVDDSGYRVVA